MEKQMEKMRPIGLTTLSIDELGGTRGGNRAGHSVCDDARHDGYREPW